MAGCRNYMIIEGPIKGDPRVKYSKNKDGSQGQLVCNIGFPLDTTEQAGMEHKDCWMPTVSFGAIAEWLSKQAPGTEVHVEGPVNANRWIDETTHLEKMTIHVVIKKVGEYMGMGQPVKWFVPPKLPKVVKNGKPANVSDPFKPSKVEPAAVDSNIQAFIDGQAATSAPGGDNVKAAAADNAEVQSVAGGSGIGAVPGAADGH